MRGVTLGDAVKDRQVPCSTSGCKGTWTWKGADQLKTWLQPGGREPPAGLCDACYEQKADFSDREAPCMREGCDGTWTWTHAERLAAWKKKQGDHPRDRLCASCHERRVAVPDVEVPCRIKGCKRTFTWPRDAQLEAGAPFAEPKRPEGMCETHAKQIREATQQKVACRTPGCDRTWNWTRWQQLEATAKKEDPTKVGPPPRYCDPCFARFRAVEDLERPCRVRGCESKWTWSKVGQVKAWKEAGEKGPVAPERMCNRCSELVSKLKDEELPCRIRSCKGTWRLPRGAQLERAAKKLKTPRRLCGSCASELAKLTDQEEPCKNQGCKGTWTWTRTAQLIAQRRHGHGKPRTPKRTCEACDRFVKEHAPADLSCVGCGTPVHFTSLAQLMVHLGRWVKPSRCPACVSKGVPAPEEPRPEAGGENVESASAPEEPQPEAGGEKIGDAPGPVPDPQPAEASEKEGGEPASTPAADAAQEESPA